MYLKLGHCPKVFPKECRNTDRTEHLCWVGRLRIVKTLLRAHSHISTLFVQTRMTFKIRTSFIRRVAAQSVLVFYMLIFLSYRRVKFKPVLTSKWLTVGGRFRQYLLIQSLFTSQIPLGSAVYLTREVSHVLLQLRDEIYLGMLLAWFEVLLQNFTSYPAHNFYFLASRWVILEGNICRETIHA